MHRSAPTPLSRRKLLIGAAAIAGAGISTRLARGEENSTTRLAARSPQRQSAIDQIKTKTLEFVRRCARDDGGYAPSPDPAYQGNSDTSLSDLAAVTYAAVLARTMGWELTGVGKSIAFVRRHQQSNGQFANAGGGMDPKDPLARLYNTTQGVVALRAMGRTPDRDPTLMIGQFFEHDAYRKLPWYATSFFPLLYAALDKPFPEAYERALADHMTAHQADDGYIQDHVAATFHMAHFFCLIGKPTPRAGEMTGRTIRDQKPDGGWNIKDPDWDVHACFDALFILRQLGAGNPDSGAAIARGGRWAMSCGNEDGGFGHYPGRHSDMDAVYFNFGSLIEAGMVPIRPDLPDARTLAWGHAMRPRVK